MCLTIQPQPFSTLIGMQAGSPAAALMDWVHGHFLRGDLIPPPELCRDRLLAIVAPTSQGSTTPTSQHIVVVLNTDFKGFTRASESLRPDILQKTLRDYMKVLRRVVTKHGGRLVRRIGDAVEAAWGTGHPSKFDLLNAFKCGKEMQKEVRRLSEKYKKKGLPYFEMRVGIDIGEARVCRLEGPGPDTLELIGPVTKGAVQAETACKPGEVNLTESALLALEAMGQTIPQDISAEHTPMQAIISLVPILGQCLLGNLSRKEVRASVDPNIRILKTAGVLPSRIPFLENLADRGSAPKTDLRQTLEDLQTLWWFRDVFLEENPSEETPPVPLPPNQRRRLLQALAPDRLEVDNKRRASARPSKSRSAERKLVTVLFTASEGFDALHPEEMERVLRDYLTALTGVVVSHGGRVIKTIEGSVMAAWGTDRSTEDDAVNAVKAALAMQQEVERINKNLERRGLPPLPTKIGVNTGTVWVGDVDDTFDIFGAEVNRTARAKSEAPPGGILILKPTQLELDRRGGLFSLEPAGFLKGKRAGEFRKPIPSYRVIGLRSPEEIPADHEKYRARFFGREDELNALYTKLKAVIEGNDARWAIVWGDAGIGKSRFEREFGERLRKERVKVRKFRTQGEYAHQQIPLKAATDIIRQAAAIRMDDNRPPTNTLYPHLIANLLGAPLEEQPPELQSILSNYDLLREKTLEAVADLFTGLLDSGLVYLMLEDMHWMDLSSLQFFSSLLQRLKNRPLFILGLTRSEPSEMGPSLSGAGERVEWIKLEALQKESQTEMARSLFANEEIDDEILQLLIAGSDGNPFLIQEIAGAMKEGWRFGRNIASGQLEFRATEGGNAVPVRTQAFLQARIDTLSPRYRDVLSRISVIGSEFTVADARLLAGKNCAPILRGLVGRGSLKETGAERFDFAHDLLRKSAYDRMPSEKVLQLHAKWARYLEETGLAEPSLIAYHFDKADEKNKASHYYSLAAEKARKMGEWTSSSSFFQKAFALAEEPQEKFRITRGWENMLGQANLHNEQERVFLLSQSLLEDYPECFGPLDKAGLWYRWGRSENRRRRWKEAENLLNRAVLLAADRATTHPDAIIILAGTYGEIGLLYVRQENYNKGLEHYKQARDLLSQSLHAESSSDNRTSRLMLMLGRILQGIAQVEAKLGGTMEVVEAFREICSIFRGLPDNQQRTMQALTGLGSQLAALGAYEEAEGILQEALELSKKFENEGQGMEPLRATLGRVLDLQGRSDEAIPILKGNLPGNPNDPYEVFTRAYLAEAYFGTGRTALAEEQAKKALEVARKRNIREGEAIASTICAQVLLQEGKTEQAMTPSQRAVDLFNDLHGVEEFDLEILLTHARILQALERRNDAASAIRIAREELNRRAEQIGDAGYRASYLEKIAVNREILRLAKELGAIAGG